MPFGCLHALWDWVPFRDGGLKTCSAFTGGCRGTEPVDSDAQAKHTQRDPGHDSLMRDPGDDSLTRLMGAGAQTCAGARGCRWFGGPGPKTPVLNHALLECCKCHPKFNLLADVLKATEMQI